MSNIDITNAIVKVTDKIKRGEIALVDESYLESIPDIDHYVLQAVLAKLRADANAVVRNIQDAQMNHEMSSQLTLPGIEHASLPAAVKDLSSPKGKARMKPLRMANAKEITTELRTYRRRVDVQNRIVGGYEATWNSIKETIPVDDEMTGSEIESQLKAITT
jgi:hypothetical protein